MRRLVTGLGLWVESVERAPDGTTHLVVGRGSTSVAADVVERLPGVRSVSLPRSSRPRVDQHGPMLELGKLRISRAHRLLAGPCAVESEARIMAIATELAPLGVRDSARRRLQAAH